MDSCHQPQARRVTTDIVRVKDFQRNVAFAAFIFVGCFACFIYVTRSLRDVLVPLVWSAFFAVPLTALISIINDGIIRVCSCLMKPFSEDHEERVHFTAHPGENVLIMELSQAVVSMLESANYPMRAYCGNWSNKGMACCRRRVRIVSLEGEGVGDPYCVNRLISGWAYYVRDPWQEDAPYMHGHHRLRTTATDLANGSSCGACSGKQAPTAANGGLLPRAAAAAAAAALAAPGDVEMRPEGEIHVEVFIDTAERYPAVISTAFDARHVDRRSVLSGVLEMDRTSSITWFASVLVSLGLVLGGIALFVIFVSLSATALQDNTSAYQQGGQELIEWVGSFLEQGLPEDVWKGMEKQAKKFVAETFPLLAPELLLFVEDMGWQALLFLLYLCFWLFEPLPINSSVAHVFKSYFLLKTMVCLLFAALMSGVLFVLDCKFWHLFFLITFVLNYIPEIGPLAAAALMVPAVLLDGNLPIAKRYANTVWLFIFGMTFKIVTGNVVEVRMYATRGGEFMRMHPVILMALMMFCEQLMGITGMFLAVPIMAAVKYFLVSADMPSVYLNPLLMLLEGDEHGPHKNFVDRHRVEINAQQDAGSEMSVDLSVEPSETD